MKRKILVEALWVPSPLGPAGPARSPLVGGVILYHQKIQFRLVSSRQKLEALRHAHSCIVRESESSSIAQGLNIQVSRRRCIKKYKGLRSHLEDMLFL